MFTIKTDRPAVEIIRDGVVTRFEYDVVVLKVEMERLLAESKKSEPGAIELQKFADYLIERGLLQATPDVALRMWSLVTVQFTQLASSIATQVQQALTQGG